MGYLGAARGGLETELRGLSRRADQSRVPVYGSGGGLALSPEAVQMRIAADVDSIGGDCGCGNHLLAEVARCQDLPRRAGADHRHLAFFADEVDLAIGSHRRSIVLTDGVLEPTLV